MDFHGGVQFSVCEVNLQPDIEMKTTYAVILLLLPLSSHAVYKCTAADGKVLFQQSPCASAAQQTVLVVKAAPAPTTPPALTVEQRMVAASARESRIKDLESRIGTLETQVYDRNLAMDQEVARLKQQSGFARNNLAGATYQQGKATEMQAVVSKYAALNAADQEQIKVLRSDLDAARRGR